MNTVLDILSELSREIDNTRGKLEALESLYARIATANGLSAAPAPLATGPLATPRRGWRQLPPSAMPDTGPVPPAPRPRSSAARASAVPAAAEPAPVPVAEPSVPSSPAMRRPSAELVAGMRSLPEPFTRAAVAVALGIEAQSASGLLDRMKCRGWLVKQARGEWYRTPIFGQA